MHGVSDSSKPTRPLAPNKCTVQEGIRIILKLDLKKDVQVSSYHGSFMGETSRLWEKFDVRQWHDAVRQNTQISVCCKRSAVEGLTRP